MKSDTQQHIIQRAGQIFFAEGFATGIDRITSECAIAKMTIYANFASKDGLICAILQKVRTLLLGNLRSHAIHTSLPPTEQLEAAFNILSYGMNDPEVRGGLGVRALLEFPQPSHPVHQAALGLDRAVLGFLEPLAAAANLLDRNAAARQLLLLAKGCFVLSPTIGIAGSRQLATNLARSTLRGSALEILTPEVALP